MVPASRIAAVHHHRGAGNEAGVLGQQERSDSSDFVGTSDTAELVLRPDGLLDLLHPGLAEDDLPRHGGVEKSKGTVLVIRLAP